MYSRDTELRNLHPMEMGKIAEYLDIKENWRELLKVIKDEGGNLLFTGNHVRIIESESELSKKSKSVIFLEEWSTMGRRRPTCGLLLDYLSDSKIYIAADYLADVLKVDHPERPKFGPEARVEIDDSILENLQRLQAQQQAPRESQPGTWSLNCQGSTAQVECLGQPVRPVNNTNGDQPVMSDLMKFSKTQSVNLMKFSTDPVQSQTEDDGNDFYYNSMLQVAPSEEIPNVVKMRGQANNDDSVTDSNLKSDSSEVDTTLSRNTESDCTTDTSRPSVESSAIGIINDDSVDKIPIPVCVLEMCAGKLQQENGKQ